jgi:triacylglycerol lipase
MRLGLGTMLAALALMLAIGGPASAQLPPLPSPGVAPPGANDPSCVSQRPPVILVHGTRGDMTISWQSLAPLLRAEGWCPHALDLPDRGQAPMAESTAAVARFTEEVRRTTGHRVVSFIGHSQGGLLARRYAKDTKGRHIDDVISMGTPQYGYYSAPPEDTIDALFNTDCPACYEFAQGSDWLADLNAGDPTPGRVNWTQIVSVADEIAKPYQNQYLPPERLVANVTLEDQCPGHSTSHLLLPYDELVQEWVRRALLRDGPVDPAQPVTC